MECVRALVGGDRHEHALITDRNLPLVLVRLAVSHLVFARHRALAVLLVLGDFRLERAIEGVQLHAEDAVIRDWLRHLRRHGAVGRLEEFEKPLVLLHLLDLDLLRQVDEGGLGLRHGRPHLAAEVLPVLGHLPGDVAHSRADAGAGSVLALGGHAAAHETALRRLDRRLQERRCLVGRLRPLVHHRDLLDGFWLLAHVVHLVPAVGLIHVIHLHLGVLLVHVRVCLRLELGLLDLVVGLGGDLRLAYGLLSFGLVLEA